MLTFAHSAQIEWHDAHIDTCNWLINGWWLTNMTVACEMGSCLNRHCLLTNRTPSCFNPPHCVGQCFYYVTVILYHEWCNSLYICFCLTQKRNAHCMNDNCTWPTQLRMDKLYGCEVKQ